MPRVSVIIPAHNAAPYIAETIACVQAQTFDDWEIVLTDDASSDETGVIARALGEPRLQVLRADANLGPAASRNLALTVASGELVALLDADDLWDERYLEHQVSTYDTHEARHGDVGVVACDARILDPDGFRPRTYMDVVHVPERLDLTAMLRYNALYGSAVAPRAVIDEAGGFTPEIWGTEDYDLWLRILERGYRAVVTREPLAVYRVSPGSVSANLGGIARALQITYANALARGNLDAAQRRIARRNLRLQRGLEAIEHIAAARGRARAALLARTLPLFAVIAVEHPHRLGYGLRALARGQRRPAF
jgi:glycosyltransferase involved in cell wall biosynthesis